MAKMRACWYSWPVPVCVEAIEKDSEGIPGWNDRLQRLRVYRDELKKTVDVQLELAKVQLANGLV